MDPNGRAPQVTRTAAAPISQTQRLQLIRRVHDDDTIPLQDRVVALLILLYAQPLIKIARLTVADVELDTGEVRLHLSELQAVAVTAALVAVALRSIEDGEPPDRLHVNLTWALDLVKPVMDSRSQPPGRHT